MNYQTLKDRQREERHQHSEALGLRVHRALSWLNRAEQCSDEDPDGQFIFLWIAFNAAYANDTGDIRIAEGKRFNEFLNRLVELDDKGQLAALTWQQYPKAIRVLLDNAYVFQPFWDHLNGLDSGLYWEEQFSKAKVAANKALASKNTGKVLAIVFNRLYTLRNQLIHGGATWNSRVNRDQVRDGSRIMADVVPVVIEIMMDHAGEHWGEACFPVVEL
ncbi:MAG: hypothetical protein LAT62_14350 [Natronospirillum sp.]|uniref:HEPN domain-containing protein n=1 Tax=Natronospirillum sp. TaxID=2812955 RepID=UPI0025CE0AB0|nr:HEPN domain-containing protein [Natronospirillum sp.]MCH8553115.1 hypothetical protein [Natronospirillum sp.]